VKQLKAEGSNLKFKDLGLVFKKIIFIHQFIDWLLILTVISTPFLVVIRSTNKVS